MLDLSVIHFHNLSVKTGAQDGRVCWSETHDWLLIAIDLSGKASVPGRPSCELRN